MKNLFLLDPDLHFLNHGSFGACPREVIQDYQRWQLEMERNLVEFLGRRSAVLLAHSRAVLAHALAVQTLHRIAKFTGLQPICQDGDLGQMVVIPVPAMNPQELKQTLFARYRIEVPITAHQNKLFIRLSVQGYNTASDADALVAAVRKIYRG